MPCCRCVLQREFRENSENTGDHSHRIHNITAGFLAWQGGKKRAASVFETCQALAVGAHHGMPVRLLGDLAAIRACGSVRIFVADSDKPATRRGPVA